LKNLVVLGLTDTQVIEICQVLKNGDTILGIKKVSFSIYCFFN
jgi:hypothetical protein